ncbi:hypothetical protein QEM13_001046 [Pseudomonas putida]|nr:hypothetical protein [Pseudomonas putida]
MRTIVPAPPLHSLENTLLIVSEHLECAFTVAQQMARLDPKPPTHALHVTVMHEIDAARSLVELTLSLAQTRH